MKNSPAIVIRPATPTDMEAVLALIKELAEYERMPNSVEISAQTLISDGFGTEIFFSCIVAEFDHTLVGMALFYPKYSTWQGRCLYLEDLIVRHEFRHQGVGSVLFRAVINEAAKKQCARLEWQVLAWNEPALHFYRKFGATFDPEWHNGRLTRHQLNELQKA